MNCKKNELRKHFISIRNSISHSRRELAEKKILDLSNLNFNKVLSFSSFFNEINLNSLNNILACKKRLLLPKIINKELLIYEITDLNTQLIEGSFKIFEPDETKCKLIDNKEISCVLVPGLAFDKNNNRLGYGKGYYDRFLSKIHCPMFGIGFVEQLSNDTLPFENHDIRLNNIFLF